MIYIYKEGLLLEVQIKHHAPRQRAAICHCMSGSRNAISHSAQVLLAAPRRDIHDGSGGRSHCTLKLHYYSIAIRHPTLPTVQSTGKFRPAEEPLVLEAVVRSLAGAMEQAPAPAPAPAQAMAPAHRDPRFRRPKSHWGPRLRRPKCLPSGCGVVAPQRPHHSSASGPELG